MALCFNIVMRNSIYAISLLALASSLSSCAFFANDKWKEEYGTPELFLERVSDNNCFIYTYDDRSDLPEDTNFEVRDALVESGPYAASSRTFSSSERFFTYENFFSHSTAGPNFCTMSVYDDGFVKIDYKSALGPHQFAYFDMDATKASAVIDLVFAKIEYEQKVYSEDYASALKSGSIDSFLVAMEEEEKVYVRVTESSGYISECVPFLDNGELLELLKAPRYEPITGYFDSHAAMLQYNYRSSEELVWTYYLDNEFDVAFLDYEYIDRVGRKSTARLCYSIDADAGKAIHAKALELSKAK